MIRRTLLRAFIALIFVGCSSNDSADVTPPSSDENDLNEQSDQTEQNETEQIENESPEDTTITYYEHVKPILDANCTSCHIENGPGGFDLTTFAATQPWAMPIAAATQARTMPPWGAFPEEDCTPRFGFHDDKSLTDEELATLAAWAETGASEGNPEDDTSSPAEIVPVLPEWDFEGSASAPINVTPGRDSFICVVIDPELTEETWIRGIDYLPGNKALVHHLVLFTDPTRASLDMMGEDGTYECFGSAGVPGSTLGGWAPGTTGNMLPDNMATRISAGTLFVLQMHYSPQGGSDDLTDLTKLRFKYADAPPKYEVYTQFMGNFDFVAHPGLGLVPTSGEEGRPEFMIPAGASQHQEINRWTFNGDLPGSGVGGRDKVGEVKLLGLTPHMHYAGVKQSVRIQRPAEGEMACESNMLMSLALCSQGAGCLEENNYLACTREACGAEWESMDLNCWGCFHNALSRIQETGDIFGELARCETEPVPMTDEIRPAEECLVNAPMYTFEWQRTYYYDAPYEELPTFTPGTVLSIECTYDNSMDNPLIRRALGRLGETEPSTIRLGDETLDEMCLTALVFAFERTE